MIGIGSAARNGIGAPQGPHLLRPIIIKVAFGAVNRTLRCNKVFNDINDQNENNHINVLN